MLGQKEYVPVYQLDLTSLLMELSPQVWFLIIHKGEEIYLP